MIGQSIKLILVCPQTFCFLNGNRGTFEDRERRGVGERGGNGCWQTKLICTSNTGFEPESKSQKCRPRFAVWQGFGTHMRCRIKNHCFVLLTKVLNESKKSEKKKKKFS